jgi:fatty-acyl-CoA synthase
MSAFTDALRRAADGDAGMVFGEPGDPRRTSYRELHDVATRAARVLVRRGLPPGGAVAVLAGVPAEVAPAAQAVWLAGGSVTMLHQPTPRTDQEHYLADTAVVLRMLRARLVVLGEPFASFAPMVRSAGVPVVTVAELLSEAAQLDRPSGGAAGSTGPDSTGPDSADPESVAQPADPDGWPADALPEVDEHLPALRQLTSGSTAAPKAVQITHGNLWANIEAMCASAGLTERDVMVSWLPLFHDMGMVGFLTLPMCRGIESVLVTPRDFLADPLLWPKLISAHRGTTTAAPNFAYALAARVLARTDAELDLSTLRFALNGAEPIDAAAVEGFLAAGERFALPATAVVCAYGMAEATLGVSFHRWGTPLEVDIVDTAALEEGRRAVPVDAEAEAEAEAETPAAGAVRRLPLLGPPLEGIEVAVFAEPDRSDRADRAADRTPAGGRGDERSDGERVALGEREVGVLHLRGPSITEQYLTVDGPRPTRDADGWLDTGDLGYVAGGQVVVCGRVKDVIIMGGRNISPTDIERVAETVEGVRAGNSVAVRWTAPGGRESFAVAVESRAAADPDAAERISAGVRSAITAQVGVRPAQVVVLPPGRLPKTPSGKLRRSEAAGLIPG